MGVGRGCTQEQGDSELELPGTEHRWPAGVLPGFKGSFESAHLTNVMGSWA